MPRLVSCLMRERFQLDAIGSGRKADCDRGGQNTAFEFFEIEYVIGSVLRDETIIRQ